MSGYGLIDYNTLNNIANALRAKTNYAGSYYPHEMPAAINSIQTSGGGFDEPIMISFYNYKFNNSDNNKFNFNQCIDFEFVNRIPVEGENNIHIFGVENWPGVSPTNVYVYARPGEREVLFRENSSFLGFISNGERISNNYRQTVVEVNGNVVNVDFGDIIANTDSNYLQWRNDIYYNDTTQKYENAWLSLHTSVGNTFGALNTHNNNTYYTVYGPIYGFGYDSNFNDNQFSIIDMSQLFSDALCNYYGPAFSGNYTRYMINTYSQCDTITEAACGPNVVNMFNCYYYCQGIKNAAVGDNVIDISNAYYSCYGLRAAYIGPNVVNAQNAYSYCNYIVQIDGNPASLQDGTSMFNYCASLVSIPNEFPALVQGYNMFYSDHNIDKLPKCPNLVNGTNMFTYINTLTQQQVQDFLDNATSLKDMTTMFNFGNSSEYVNLMNLNFPEHIETIDSLFTGDTNYISYECVDVDNNIWTNVTRDWVGENAVCPNTVKNTRYLYYGKYQIKNPVVGDNVIDMSMMYQTCGAIIFNNGVNEIKGIETAVCGPNVIFMNGSYSYCLNLKTAVSGPNVRYMYQTYYNCHLLQTAVCGINVIDMNGTYMYCNNITDAVCGDNVIFMNGTYARCDNLINAACGNNVIHLSNTYQNCPNLVEPACGNNVIYMDYTYANCFNLVNAVSGPNTVNMQGTYQNCYNLNEAVCGDKVVNFNYAYQNCRNLKIAACGNNVANMYYTYQNCQNLTDAVIGANTYYTYSAYAACPNIVNARIYGNCPSAFSQPTKLVNLYIDDNVKDLTSSFFNARKLTNVTVPSKIVTMSSAFNNCVNLACDISIGENCSNMSNAFRNCYMIQNIYIAGNKFGPMTYASSICHAFYRYPNVESLGNRRNIVVSNYEGWNKLVWFNVAGNYTKTNEVYETPVEVNVNGIAYNCVRCSYNTANNIYIYCME